MSPSASSQQPPAAATTNHIKPFALYYGSQFHFRTKHNDNCGFCANPTHYGTLWIRRGRRRRVYNVQVHSLRSAERSRPALNIVNLKLNFGNRKRRGGIVISISTDSPRNRQGRTRIIITGMVRQIKGVEGESLGKIRQLISHSKTTKCCWFVRWRSSTGIFIAKL